MRSCEAVRTTRVVLRLFARCQVRETELRGTSSESVHLVLSSGETLREAVQCTQSSLLSLSMNLPHESMERRREEAPDCCSLTLEIGEAAGRNTITIVWLLVVERGMACFLAAFVRGETED